MTTTTNGHTPAKLNALKHGGRLVVRLNLGELPTPMRRQTASARAYRRELEQFVVTAKGQVDLESAHWIDEACCAEIHSSICRWLLRERLDVMTVQDIITCSREILRSKATRNRAVERLELDAGADPSCPPGAAESNRNENPFANASPELIIAAMAAMDRLRQDCELVEAKISTDDPLIHRSRRHGE
jgi:hypothetical protein